MRRRSGAEAASWAQREPSPPVLAGPRRRPEAWAIEWLEDASRRTPSPVSALRYLYARTLANRLRAQLARARSPRYLVAVVLGVFYLWWALFRNTKLGGGPLASIVRVETAIPVFALFALLSAARWWLFGSDRSALAFTPAEVTVP